MYESVLTRFHRLRPTNRPDHWQALCPAHDDRQPSLSLAIGRNGALLLKCFRGCSVAAILHAVGVRMASLYPEGDDQKALPRATEPKPKPVLVATYPYENEAGMLLYEKLRYQPKGFVQRAPTTDPLSKSGWQYHLAGVRRVLYRLPQLVSNPLWPVVVTEGEKDADNLAAALGSTPLCVTTNTEGAGWQSEGRWSSDYSEVLRGRRVAIIPDNDEPGRVRAYFVAGSLLAHGVGSLRLVSLPGLKEKQDLTDWLKAGGTKERLLALIKDATEFVPAQRAA